MHKHRYIHIYTYIHTKTYFSTHTYIPREIDPEVGKGPFWDFCYGQGKERQVPSQDLPKGVLKSMQGPSPGPLQNCPTLPLGRSMEGPYL